MARSIKQSASIEKNNWVRAPQKSNEDPRYVNIEREIKSNYNSYYRKK